MLSCPNIGLLLAQAKLYPGFSNKNYSYPTLTSKAFNALDNTVPLTYLSNFKLVLSISWGRYS